MTTYEYTAFADFRDVEILSGDYLGLKSQNRAFSIIKRFYGNVDESLIQGEIYVEPVAIYGSLDEMKFGPRAYDGPQAAAFRNVGPRERLPATALAIG
jgi:hypothetical protein